MSTLPPELTNWIVVFAPLFSKRVWQSAQLLLTGAILAVGSRTVTAVLRVMGLSQEKQFQKYHRVLNRAKWSTLAASRRLLLALVDAFMPEGPLLMGLDDTIERRRGAQIAAKGIYRDPVRSSRSHFVKASGLRWLCLMLLAPIPWAGRCWALPFCSVLAPSERYYRERHRRPNTLTDRARQPALKTVLQDAATAWRKVTLARWYSQGARRVEIATGAAVWYHSGMPVVPLRWVLVRDPEGRFEPQAFLCTGQTATPEQILAWFVQRWQVEVTFEEARAHLGMETQRQWSDRAIARTTPALLGLYSVVTLLARQLWLQRAMPVRTACWYPKKQATFSDTIALVRRWLWSNGTFSISEKPPDMVQIPRELLERLTDTLSYAA